MPVERSNFMVLDENLDHIDIINKAFGLFLKEPEPEPNDPNACKVCRDIKHFTTINIGTVWDNAEITKCMGCSFLATLVWHVFGGQLDVTSMFMLFPKLGGGNFLLCVSPPSYKTPTFRWTGLVEVYREEGKFCPWRKIKIASHLSGDTGSEEALAKIPQWIDKCIEQHTRCPKNRDVELPARLLDLEAFEDSADVRLVISTEKMGRYAALSHRWIDGQTLTTTKATFEGRLDRIKSEDMPQTFNDAIKVARSLKLRYIWIDSLCIIQGPESTDWILEAPKMATVYSNAYLTISSSRAAPSGLFSKASAANIGSRLNITSRCGKHDPYAVFYRMPVNHRLQPLQSRCWVFQESLLSPRVINFADSELIFECTERTVCECGVVEPIMAVIDPNINYFHDSGAFGRKVVHYQALCSEKLNVLKNRWRDMIHEYTRRSLTYQSDVFPALAGLAKQMQKSRNSEYYTGLWEDTLATDLLWAVRNVGSYEEDQYVDVKGLTRPNPWRAPTWSWASTTGPVTWAHLGYLWKGATGSNLDRSTGTFLEVLKVDVVPEIEGDTTMGIKRGKLQLRGPLTKVGFEINDKGILSVSAIRPDYLPEDKPLNMCFRPYPDYDYTIEGEHRVIDARVVSLLVSKVLYSKYAEYGVEETVYFSLLLVCVDETKAEYKRIGLLEHDFAFVAEKATLTLL